MNNQTDYKNTSYLRRYTLTEGREAGLKIIEGYNGKLRFLLNESKALDVSELWYKGERVNFLSKNGLNASEAPFLKRFEGGMVYTCGLESVGDRAGFEMHGTLHNVPALVTRAQCDGAGITVEAEIAVGELFGKNLLLKRRIFSANGSETLEINDTLVNRSFRDEDYCLLYHVNLGYPFIDEGARISGATERVIPRTEWAKEHLGEREIITAPVPNQFETCYFIKVKEPCFTLSNERLKRAFTLEWSKETLPCFLQWKSMANDDYALGFEPCTTFIDERFALSKIKAGEAVNFSLKLKLSSL